MCQPVCIVSKHYTCISVGVEIIYSKFIILRKNSSDFTKLIGIVKQWKTAFDLLLAMFPNIFVYLFKKVSTNETSF